ncbi:uncharacterized protein LOC127252251 [Andrographis paniculata]|uniref:uncharacterized protein LOC127252251 n=1 Tax=Andrographis paniculata TaxID=175694 RepID=UPI0021E884DD|nr:uncharacterized protein LOC127252251 [Andrographis paniculata]
MVLFMGATLFPIFEGKQSLNMRTDPEAMAERVNADAKWSENQMEGEDTERTVNCLRGRLLAERTASRKARDEAEQLGNKLMELENLLKEESKSRNRAEKKLKLLIKKLASMSISYLMDSTDISSVSSSSTASSSTKEPEMNGEKTCTADLPQNNSSVSVFADNFKEAEIMEQSVRRNASTDSLASEQLKSTGIHDDLSFDQDPGNHVDNSMALVTVDLAPPEKPAIDPKILDGTVKEVLDTLRHAKEQLLTTMERRRGNMVKVG